MEPLSAFPLISDLETCEMDSRALIRGLARGDTPRRLEDPRAVYMTAWLSFEICRGLPDIQFLVEWSVQLPAPHCFPREVAMEVVETRRLELLTPSLQRRCSSN